MSALRKRAAAGPVPWCGAAHHDVGGHLVQLGTILLWGTDIDVFRHQLRLAEELGYSAIGVGDSPAAWQDMYVSLAVAALETEHWPGSPPPLATEPRPRRGGYSFVRNMRTAAASIAEPKTMVISASVQIDSSTPKRVIPGALGIMTRRTGSTA